MRRLQASAERPLELDVRIPSARLGWQVEFHNLYGWGHQPLKRSYGTKAPLAWGEAPVKRSFEPGQAPA
jgi:hypothetical protein